MLLNLAIDYGPDVFNYRRLSRVSDNVRKSWAFLNWIRPLDHPPLWPYPVTEGATPGIVAVAAATRIFVEDERKRCNQVPQWEVTAFWFASTMVHIADAEPEFAKNFTSTLSMSLENWRLSFKTAIYIVGCLGREFLSVDDGEGLWNGYLADLRHAGALTIAREMNEDPTSHANLRNSLETVYAEWEQLGCALPSGRQGRLAGDAIAATLIRY